MGPATSVHSDNWALPTTSDNTVVVVVACLESCNRFGITVDMGPSSSSSSPDESTGIEINIFTQ